MCFPSDGKSRQIGKFYRFHGYFTRPDGVSSFALI